MDNRKPRLGVHVSVAGGFDQAFRAGAEIGCDCLQIFVKNQRQWRVKPLSDVDVEKFNDGRSATGLAPVVAHAGYLINLASPESSGRQRSVEAMIDELQRCDLLGVEFLVVHPGAHLEDSMEAGIARVAESLDELLERSPSAATRVLLETTAGQGSAIGHRFEQLAAILDRVRERDRVGVCLDTCHLFAAGYDYRNAEGYAAMMNELDSVIGLALVRCVHMNDSKRELGSRVDRHEHIGKGKIGKSGFAHFLNDPCLTGVPMILETPKGKDGRGADYDSVNLNRLRSLVNVVPQADY